MIPLLKFQQRSTPSGVADGKVHHPRAPQAATHHWVDSLFRKYTASSQGFSWGATLQRGFWAGRLESGRFGASGH
jgi:hypothetical protein